MTAYYCSFEIVQGRKCFRCDLPYKSSQTTFLRNEAINHIGSILSHSINGGLIDMNGMSAKDFAKEIVVNERTAMKKYDVSFQLSIDNWKSASHPTFLPYQFRLNLIDEKSTHVPYVKDDVSWKVKKK